MAMSHVCTYQWASVPQSVDHSQPQLLQSSDGFHPQGSGIIQRPTAKQSHLSCLHRYLEPKWLRMMMMMMMIVAMMVRMMTVVLMILICIRRREVTLRRKQASRDYFTGFSTQPCSKHGRWPARRHDPDGDNMMPMMMMMMMMMVMIMKVQMMATMMILFCVCRWNVYVHVNRATR